ncbi:MAG: ABC transporter substrate-binding protein [Candidatus Omnitrophota bacterium]|nr:ABC transporter substrate-binding protein [Candidatus Omnitrophota bacterium]MDZ4242136.1 ABC transporter substrate-binding protein [Candidatus Omnitrophota bacterium]
MKLRGFLFLAALSLSLAPCPPARADNKHGGQIVLSTTSDPRSFNDIIAKETSTSEITGLIFEGLTRTDPETLKIIPTLAERWEVSEDGLTWTFHLRRGVQWNDGHPFTADDVVFTYNDLIFNPDIPTSSRDIFTIDGKPFAVFKIDDHTVRFILPVKFAPFLRGVGQAIVPKHKLAQPLKEGKFNFTWGIDTAPREIVGTGPFRLAKYEPGQRIVLEGNPYYWRKSAEGDRLPYVDRLIFLIVQNADVELLKFLEGSVDAYSFRGMDYPLLKPMDRERNFTVYDMGPAFGSNFLAFNLNAGQNPKTSKPFVDPAKLSWFTDPAFRRAVAHAVDKKRMIEIVKNGLGYPQDSPMSPADAFFYNPGVPQYEYDLEKAARTLNEAGFKRKNGDGVLEDSQGRPVEFTLYTNADNSERMDIAAIIRNDLEKLGMRINFKPVEFNTLVSKLTSTFEWDALVMGLTGGVEPHFGKNVWSSDGQLHLWNPRQKAPATDWEKRIDELFSLGVQELDEGKRKVFYDEFQVLVSQQLPVIYTVLSARISAVRNRFGNLRPTAYGGIFHNLEEIYILPEQRRP